MKHNHTDVDIMKREQSRAEQTGQCAGRDPPPPPPTGPRPRPRRAEVAPAPAALIGPGELELERERRVESERAGRIKDEFLATLSHELRTPLSAILGWSYVLKQGRATPDELAEGLEVIDRNARAQGRLIDDMLDVSRIITGKMRLDVQRVELPGLIGAAVESIRLAAEAKGVRLVVDLDTTAGAVTGDPNRLQQVVCNLLSNAIKFTPRDGAVRVTLERVNSHVELSVSDTGSGIAADFLPHVFEKFSQAEPGFIRGNRGLGLGLAIVKHLTELHGGSARAKSAGEGRGATFVVALPVSAPRARDEREHAAAPRRAVPPDPDLSGVRVLVVDDDAEHAELVRRILVACNASVTTCASVPQCLAALPASKPHVLLTDIGLRETDGYALIRQLRALPPAHGGTLPAVALTALARSEDRRQAMLAGFDIHVAKPVEPGELLAVVARLARRG
jgi:signal transduction histidine kinase/CheY-like chemotaxis protein